MAARFELVLDRFVPIGGTSAIDLASGECVHLRQVAARGRPDDRLRVEAAATVWSLRIPGMATLVDFGAWSRDQWVEAYRLEPSIRPAGAARACSGAAAPVAALLRRGGCAIRCGRQRSDLETTRSGLFIPVPLDRVVSAEASADTESPANAAARPAAGLRLERRDELDAVMEWMAGSAEAGARILRIDAPPAAGLRTFFHAVAREARLAGYVPVSSRLCSHRFVWPGELDAATFCAALRGRHVVVLDPAGGHTAAAEGEGIARFLARLDLVGGWPHAVVSAGPPLCGESSIRLQPMRPEQLRRSVLCAGIDEGRVASAIRDAIRRSGGWPGAFNLIVTELLGTPGTGQPYRLPRSGAGLVREAAAEPCAGVPAGSRLDEKDSSMLLRARVLAGRGRHAAAERLLRRAIGYCRRRRRVAEEAQAQLALGRLLMARGRRVPAREAFEECRRLADDAQDTAGVIRALLHLGSASIDDGDLSAAESVLKTADVAATRAAMEVLRRAAVLLLARCLFWQGRHEDALQQLERQHSSAGNRLSGAGAVAERCEPGATAAAWGAPASEARELPELLTAGAEVGVRVALARKDAGLAARRLAAASEGRPLEDPAQEGRMVALSLLVQGALGDAASIGKTVGSGLDRMRRCHAPLAAQEIRLAQIEALIDAGARAQAAACLRRLSGKASPALSGLARLRLDALSARMQNQNIDVQGGRAESGGTVDTEAVLRILQRCHDAPGEAEAVVGVCQTVRTVLRAGAVSAFALAGDAMRLVASAGARPCRMELAGRSALSLLAIGPEQSAAGCELAAPIRYGGAAIGALAVRWPPGATGGEARARGIAVAAAAAIGPAMAALGSVAPARNGEDAAPGEIGGPSAAMAEVRRQVTRAAAAPYPVLILGESGTGKELIAKAIHAGSPRKARRFCAVNCAALSDDLFETELFGHARGSFTGAAADRLGLFEEADGGTLFLDEVGELSPRAQAKLLRAIQEGEIRRLGENHPRRVDTRIVAATNRLLSDDARAGRFRHDLLYRLDVVRITVPPLRERPEDVAPLAMSFWREAMRRTGGQAELSPATLAALARYDWPGNVRELQNTLAALAVHAPARGRVGPSQLPAAIAGSGVYAHGEPVTLAEARRRFEERFVRATLARTGGRRTEAASALGVSRQGLAKLIARLGIDGETTAAQSPMD